MIPYLQPEEYEEIRTLKAEMEDAARIDALAAELFMLRELHRKALRVLKAPLFFIQIMNRIPRVVGDIGAWQRAVSEARPRYERFRSMRDGTHMDITGK